MARRLCVQYINALVARIEGYSIQYDLYGQTEGLKAEQNQLLYELHDALNKYRVHAGGIEVTAAEVRRRLGN